MIKRLLNRIRYWYLSKSALPYWSVILVDFLIIIVAASISIYVCEGPRAMINHFWDRALTWCCLLPFFFIGMRLFHTYSGVIRYLRSADLLRVLYAQVVGFAFIFCIRPFFSENQSIMYTGLKTYATTFCLSAVEDNIRINIQQWCKACIYLRRTARC